MTLVPGTRGARIAWYALRGPYALAYIGLLVIASVTEPIAADVAVWKAGAALSAMALVAGCAFSFVAINSLKPKAAIRCGEALEVSGLRLLILVEFGYVAWSLLGGRAYLIYTTSHLVLGLFALGALMSMTWKRGRKYGLQ